MAMMTVLIDASDAWPFARLQRPLRQRSAEHARSTLLVYRNSLNRFATAIAASPGHASLSGVPRATQTRSPVAPPLLVASLFCGKTPKTNSPSSSSLLITASLSDEHISQ